MFEISSTELLLVCVIGLLVLGPKRLPKVAAEIGKWVNRARRTASQLRRQLEREVELSEIEKDEPKTPPPPPPTAPTPPEAASQPDPESPPSAAPKGNGAGDPHALPVDDGHKIGGGADASPPPPGPADESHKPDTPDKHEP
jgi:sec-independent protein translocase protein TatB